MIAMGVVRSYHQMALGATRLAPKFFFESQRHPVDNLLGARDLGRLSRFSCWTKFVIFETNDTNMQLVVKSSSSSIITPLDGTITISISIQNGIDFFLSSNVRWYHTYPHERGYRLQSDVSYFYSREEFWRFCRLKSFGKFQMAPSWSRSLVRQWKTQLGPTWDTKLSPLRNKIIT